MIIIEILARGSCGLVTTVYTSGSGGVWMTAFCAMALAAALRKNCLKQSRRVANRYEKLGVNLWP